MGKNKQKIAVLFGGVSSEHDVSLKSASFILKCIDEEKYDIYPVGITMEGEWLLYNGDRENIPNGTWEKDKENLKQVFFTPNTAVKGFLVLDGDEYKEMHCDLVFPVLHGKNGEDGTLQGMLQMSGMKFVGCDCSSSSLCMDKGLTNMVLDNAYIPQAEWVYFNHVQYSETPQKILEKIENVAGYPCFVKPANAGSSVGITKATDRLTLVDAIKVAFKEDDKVLVEKNIDGKEVECAVLGNHDAIASTVGEIKPCNEFYDYEAKYEGDSDLYIPARINDDVIDKIRHYALMAYKVLGCKGLARVDFFVRRSDNQVLLNEVNTLPGFTEISMYPKLFEKGGIDGPTLVDTLINLALE